MPTTLPVRYGFVSGSSHLTPPDYAHPPLIECWLGVDFVDSLEQFEVDPTALRESLGAEWFGSWQTVADDTPGHDRQLENVMGDRAVRLTSCGFAYGWLGHQGERYPRYETIRDGFVTALDAIRRVTRGTERRLSPKRWSIRYVNRIPQGTVWVTTGDWSFFRLWQPVPLAVWDADSQGYKGRWEFPLPAERGTLAIKFRHDSGQTAEDLEEVRIMLHAKGPVDGVDSELFEGLDYGREVVVRSFHELIAVDAQNYWGASDRLP